MLQKQTLWTPNFTIITLGTIISAIGGVGTSFALNLVVFQETNSTFLSGLYTALTLIPQIILPIFVGPLIDRFSRKKIIVFLDYLMGIFFLGCSLLTFTYGFNYYLFIFIGIILNINSIIYSTAYDSLFPDLIPDGMFQKGYSISSMIYPLTSTAFMPIAALCFEHFGVTSLFVAQGILLFIAATFECFICINENLTVTQLTRFSDYIKDIKGGFNYLKNEPGIYAVFKYFFFTMLCSQGISTLLVAFFDTHPFLTATSYALLLSAESIGRLISGFVLYFYPIAFPSKYQFATISYFAYEIIDSLLMFVAFPVMIIARFIIGFLGTTSANIRVSSIQSYLPSEKRGRINSLNQLLSLAGVLCGSLLSGILGEYIPYATIGVMYGIIGCLAVYFNIIKNKDAIKKIYNRTL